MPKTLVTTLIHNVAGQLNDRNFVHWRREDLLAWFNSARKAVIEKRPDANSKNKIHVCTPTAKQTLSDNSVRLLNVIGNHNGSGITAIDKKILDMRVPGWMGSAETSSVRHYIYDPRDPKTFYLYRRPRQGLMIEILASEYPPDVVIDNFDSDTQTIGISDQYSNAIENYMLSRAWLKDANYANNPNLSAKYFTEFNQLMGDTTKADAATTPTPTGTAQQ